MRPCLSSKPYKVTSSAGPLSTRCSHRISTCFAHRGASPNPTVIPSGVRCFACETSPAVEGPAFPAHDRTHLPHSPERAFSARADAEDSRLRKDLLEVLATYRQNPSRSFAPESNPVAGIIYFRLTEIDAGHLARDTNSYSVRLPRNTLDALFLYHTGPTNASGELLR